MKKISFIFSFFVLYVQLAFADRQYYFSNLSVKDGLSQQNVTCILQDKLGYMWFGTRYGLNKFNGNSFEVFLSHDSDSMSISDNIITCIEEDSLDNLWIGTDDGLNRLGKDRVRFKRYYLAETPDSVNNKIMSLHVDDDGVLWVGALDGLYAYSPLDDKLKKMHIEDVDGNSVTAVHKKGDNLYLATNVNGLVIYDWEKKRTLRSYRSDSSRHRIPSDYLKEIFLDRKGNLWLGTYENGACMIAPHSYEITVFDTSNGLSDNHIRCIRESSSGEIWIGTSGGLDIINPVTKRVTHCMTGYQGRLPHNSIYSIMFDNMQTVWVGTYAGGVYYSNPYGHLFDFYNPSAMLNSYVGILGDLVEYDGVLYICSEGGGLVAFDVEKNIYSQYKLPDNGRRQFNILKTVFLEEGRLLCGTSQGEIYAFDLRTHEFSLLYRTNHNRPIYHIGKSRSGEYVIGAIGDMAGLTFVSGEKWDTVQTEFPVAGKGNFRFPHVICVLEIDDDVFLIGTKSDGLFYYDKKNHVLKSYGKDDGLMAESISSILKDRQGRIWISSSDDGLSEFMLSTGKFVTYNERNGLSSNMVCKVVEGNDNQLWLATLNGISSLDLRTRNIVNYGMDSGIQVHEFSLSSGLLLSDNRIVFAGNNGFVMFNPNNIITNPNIPPMIFDNLYVNNKLILPGGTDGILDESISTQKEIFLDYDQTNIKIEYSALNYIFNNKNKYLYILEGFDKDWNDVGNQRFANYTNIPPGKYHFVVKGTNNDGIWNEEGARLGITIYPPLWKTWWAYVLYFVLFFALVAFVFRYFLEKKRLENSVRMKQLEVEVQEEYYQERNRLFTNFSHELRTPLTLIIAPLEELARRTDLAQEISYKAKLMLSNAKRLLRIVNNLMDLQKNESGTMRLKVSNNDIVEFTQEAVDSFSNLALYRNIHLRYNHLIESQKMWFDWNLLEKVYFNFLSNAFKNVPDGGNISVELEVKPLSDVTLFTPSRLNRFKNNDIKYLVVAIQDSGTGIAQEELEKIFRPFYQVAQNEHSQSGTGIGLSLSKAIIEMHHGVVWAENAPSKGAIFKFVIPIDKNLYSEAEISYDESEKEVRLDVELPEIAYAAADSSKKQFTVLVVEDNRDLNNYICSYLSDKYNVVGVQNGADALAKAINILPNLIVTDLMMPKMDGLELIRRLKDNVNTSHIPIIMLTAKTDADDIKKGFSAGADEYIVKPFDAEILKVRIENLIQSRGQLKELYGKNFTLEALGVDVTSVDEKFMQKLYEVLQQNITNSDLNLDAFCKELGLSKSNLYRKIKQITGYSPNEFIRNYRLSIAAKMLKETDMTITEVYCAVGYSSLAYFSNSFKALYGVSPSEFKHRTESEKNDADAVS